MQLEFHQLDRRWEHLRVRHPARQRRLLAALADSGQQTPVVVVAAEGQADRYVVIDGYKRITGSESQIVASRYLPPGTLILCETHCSKRPCSAAFRAGTRIQQKKTSKIQEREDALRSNAHVVSVEPMMHSSRRVPSPGKKDGAGG